jgi:hypothetical protein
MLLPDKLGGERVFMTGRDKDPVAEISRVTFRAFRDSATKDWREIPPLGWLMIARIALETLEEREDEVGDHVSTALAHVTEAQAYQLRLGR